MKLEDKQLKSSLSNHKDQLLSDQNLYVLLEFVPDTYLAINQSGQIEAVNRQTKSLIGYKQKEIIGKEIEFLILNVLHSNNHGHFIFHLKNYRVGSNARLVFGHERVRFLKGEFTISGSPGEDTNVIVTIPLRYAYATEQN